MAHKHDSNVNTMTRRPLLIGGDAAMVTFRAQASQRRGSRRSQSRCSEASEDRAVL